MYDYLGLKSASSKGSGSKGSSYDYSPINFGGGGNSTGFNVAGGAMGISGYNPHGRSQPIFEASRLKDAAWQQQQMAQGDMMAQAKIQSQLAAQQIAGQLAIAKANSESEFFSNERNRNLQLEMQRRNFSDGDYGRKQSAYYQYGIS